MKKIFIFTAMLFLSCLLSNSQGPKIFIFRPYDFYQNQCIEENGGLLNQTLHEKILKSLKKEISCKNFKDITSHVLPGNVCLSDILGEIRPNLEYRYRSIELNTALFHISRYVAEQISGIEGSLSQSLNIFVVNCQKSTFIINVRWLDDKWILSPWTLHDIDMVIMHDKNYELKPGVKIFYMSD